MTSAVVSTKMLTTTVRLAASKVMRGIPSRLKEPWSTAETTVQML
jgi:hypothetical protein